MALYNFEHERALRTQAFQKEKNQEIEHIVFCILWTE